MAFFKLQVGDPLSFSIVLYSRKVVGDYVKKQLKIKTILDAADNVVNPHLPDCWWLLKPILTAIEQVDSEANTNALWDDQSLLEKYASESRCDADSDEYTGHYISLRSGYDRTRYWSCVKYLFDTIEARRIFHWTREQAMGFICFVTLEGCSAFLLSGIIDECLCSTSPKWTALIQDANKYGMYAALIFAAHGKNENGCNSFAPFGCSRLCRDLYSDPKSCVGYSMYDDHRKKISDRCANVVHKLLVNIVKLQRSIKSVDAKRRKVAVDTHGLDFFRIVKECGGPGVSDSTIIDFIQLSCLLGFLPYDMIGWACIESTRSDAYRAINTFYQKTTQLHQGRKDDLSLEEATKYFHAMVKYMGSNVSWNFTPALAYNILCKFNEDGHDVTNVSSPDILYLYRHHEGEMHPIYRWKMDTAGKAILQCLVVTKHCKVKGIFNVMEVSRDGDKDPGSTFYSYWTGDDNEYSVFYRRGKYGI
jgi:hypothetical protein